MYINNVLKGSSHGFFLKTDSVNSGLPFMSPPPPSAAVSSLPFKCFQFRRMLSFSHFLSNSCEIFILWALICRHNLQTEDVCGSN